MHFKLEDCKIKLVNNFIRNKTHAINSPEFPNPILHHQIEMLARSFTMENLPYTDVDGVVARYVRTYVPESPPAKETLSSPSYSAPTSPVFGCIVSASMDAGFIRDSLSPSLIMPVASSVVPPVLDLNKGSTCASKRRIKKGKLSRKKGKGRKTTKAAGKA